MKCADTQKDIYLFDEMDVRRQQQIMAHVETCADCKRVFDEVGHSRQLIKRMTSTTPQLQDARRFTNQVMSSIRLAKQGQRNPFVDALLNYLSLSTVKYSMATLSFAFIGFFLVEFTQNNEPIERKQIARVTTTQPVKLNTASFFQQFQKVKTEGQTGASISQCLVECRHNPQMDCSSCKTKYLNIIKHHEKI